MTRPLLLISAASFAIVGVGYLVAPGAMLSIVGIASSPTTDFLMRTEGVALLTGAALIWVARDALGGGLRIALAALAFYFVIGSIVDLLAWSSGIVGSAAVPSAAIRIVLGLLCAVAAARPVSSRG